MNDKSIKVYEDGVEREMSINGMNPSVTIRGLVYFLEGVETMLFRIITRSLEGIRNP